MLFYELIKSGGLIVRMKQKNEYCKVIAFAVIVTLATSSCHFVSKPLVLRNRPNVPPPAIRPSTQQVAKAPVVKIEPMPIQTFQAPKPVPSVKTIDNVEVITVDEASKPVLKSVDEKPIAMPDIQSAPLTHTVERGDSFWTIARAYGISKGELAACNNMSVNQPLKVGSTLVIPPGGVLGYKAPPIKRHKIAKKTPARRHVAATKKFTYKPPKRSTRPKKTSVPKSYGSSGTYTVQNGDSLWKIARRHGVTTSQLASANGIDTNKTLKIGMKLVIPGKSASTSSYTPKRKLATVKKSNPKKGYLNSLESSSKSNVKPKRVAKSNNTSELDKLLNDAEQSVDSNKTPSTDDILSNDADLNNLLESDTDDLIDDTVDNAPSNIPKDNYYTEQILPDETIEEIAERNGFTIEEILKVNPQIKPGEKIKSFSTINIPKKKIK